jgi:hypothetical protein
MKSIKFMYFPLKQYFRIRCLGWLHYYSSIGEDFCVGCLSINHCITKELIDKNIKPLPNYCEYRETNPKVEATYQKRKLEHEKFMSQYML